MGTLVELLAHFQKHRATRPVHGLASSLAPEHLRLEGAAFRPASIIAQLLDTNAVVSLDSDIDAVKLEAEVARAKRVHRHSGLSTLWLSVGTVQAMKQEKGDDLGAPILQIPIIVTQDAQLRWHIHNQGSGLLIHPSVQDVQKKAPGQSYRAWWLALTEALMKDLAGSQAARFDLGCTFLGCLSQAAEQIAKDLEPDRWGDEATLATHPVISPLLGPGFLMDQRQDAFTAPYLSGQEGPLDQLWVEDADRHQAKAILAACSGESLVIQGPCGSGKTQTLTNIVGSLVGMGRKVLLLSESCEDLQALQARLHNAHLGHACLCIYDEQRSDDAAAIDLIATLELGAPSSPDRGAYTARYVELQDQLNRYADAMREPLGNSGWCYQEVVGRLLAIKQTLQDQGLPKLGFDAISHWTQADFDHAKALIAELVEHIQTHGSIAASSFADIDLGALTPENAGEWCDRIAQVAADAQLLTQSCDSVFSQLDLDPPADFHELGQWVSAFDHFASRPELGGLVLDRELWTAKAASVVELVASARLCESIKAAHQDVLLDTAWEADVMPLRSALRDQGGKWWRRASKRWRLAQSTLQGLMRGALPQEQERALSLVEAVVQYQSEARTTERLATSVAELFGPHWNGEDSNWDHLERCTEWLTTLLDAIKAKRFPAALWKVLELDAEVLANASELSQLYTNLDEQLCAVGQETGVSLGDQGIEHLERRLVTWSEQRAELLCALEYRSLEGKLRGVGLSGLVTLAQSWSHPLDMIEPTVAFAYLSGLEALAFAERPQLRDATYTKLEAIRAEFSALDQGLPALAQEQLCAILHDRRLPADDPELVALIQSLQDPQKRHDLPALIDTHWEAMSTVKPIVLATPATLSTNFRQARGSFDTVLIDRGGTMPLSDALGGILRSKQLIVVGDSRQSPALAPAANPANAAKGLVNPQQSILHRCQSQGAAEYLLSLHYRSKHDSLVNYVNDVFYEGALKVPPSPVTPSDELGLTHQPPIGELGCDDHARGIDGAQADQVVDAVVAQLLEQPEQSLGVVTLSEAQAETIGERLRLKQKEHPELADLLCPQRDEPFFIQSLHAASREDRSVIFLSLGYGIDRAGSISANWGVLQGSDGHRKLSIALTRARERFQVFGNLEAQDIHCCEETPTGLSILSGFLEQAQNCSQRIFDPAQAGDDSAFAKQVRAAIVQLGFGVRSPTAAHEVDADLYVYDPEQPQVALVGILCDTARYHRQTVARDRERIGPSLLYNMGWRLHRLWCRDWLADPEKETQRLANTLAGLRTQLPWSHPKTASAPESEACANQAGTTARLRWPEISRSETPKIIALPFSIYEPSFDRLPLGRLANLDELAHIDLGAAMVVALEHEGEMHVELLALRLAQRVERLASSPALRDAVASSLDQLVRTNRIQKNGHFVSLQCQQTLPVRTRVALARNQRRLKWVPQSERDQALVQAATQEPQADHEQILTSALRSLGLLCLGAGPREQLQKRILELDSAGKLRPKPLTGQAA